MSITKKGNLWDGKNLIELRKKFENNGESVGCDTTGNIGKLNRNVLLPAIIKPSGRKIPNLTGTKFGRLEVVSYVGDVAPDKYVSKWLCRCECGGKKIVRSDLLKSGLTKSCGCLYARKGNNNPLWRGVGELSKTVLTRIREDAKIRKIHFNLSLEFLWDLFLKQNRQCALTGDPIGFGKTGRDSNRSASLDRKDPSLGYIEENVQWVHKDVNFAKQRMTQEEFIVMCKKVSSFKRC